MRLAIVLLLSLKMCQTFFFCIYGEESQEIIIGLELFSFFPLTLRLSLIENAEFISVLLFNGSFGLGLLICQCLTEEGRGGGDRRGRRGRMKERRGERRERKEEGGILCSDLEERQVHSVLSKLPASDKPQAPGSGTTVHRPQTAASLTRC